MQIIIQEQIYQNDPGLVWVEKAIQNKLRDKWRHIKFQDYIIFMLVFSLLLLIMQFQSKSKWSFLWCKEQGNLSNDL